MEGFPLMSDCVGSLGGKGAHCSESLFFVEVLYKFKPNVIKFTFLYMLKKIKQKQKSPKHFKAQAK